MSTTKFWMKFAIFMVMALHRLMPWTCWKPACSLKSTMCWTVRRRLYMTGSISTISAGIYNGRIHYDDVIMGILASQIVSFTIVYSTDYSGADQRKHKSSASLAFVWGIHRGQVNSPHKWPATRKMFPFDDVIMWWFESVVVVVVV